MILFSILFLPLFINAQFLMFPGDTNNDGVANYIDIIPIGLAYGSEGSPRELINTDWIPQEFNPFGQFLPASNVEYGFIDCDGNGLIDSLDVEAIALNYDSMQAMANPPPINYQLPDTFFTTNIPQINVQFSVDTAGVQDTVFADINIIFPTPPITNPALGLALGLEYDPVNIKDSLTVIFVDTLSNDLMYVTAASNFLNFWRLPQPGRIEIGAAGRGQNAINNSRTIATVMIVVEDLIIRSQGVIPFSFSLADVILVNDQEQVLEVSFFSDTLLLIDSVVGVEDQVFSNNLKVYPNPARDQIQIKSDLPIEQLILYNQFGLLTREAAIPNLKNVSWKNTGLPSGMYILHIKTAVDWHVRKLILLN
jgi:hypothetical protein